MDLKQLKLTEKRTLICEKLGLHNSDEILNYYPMKYDQLVPVHYADFKEGETVTFEGSLLTYPSTFRGRVITTRFRVDYEDEELLITIFNRPWLRGLSIGQNIVITGTYDGNGRVTATNYYTKPLSEVLGITPFYSLKEGIAQHEIRKLIEYTLKKCELKETLPSSLIEDHHLISYRDAITGIHYPESREMLAKAMSRLKYEEFVRFYLSLEIVKGNRTGLFKLKKEFSDEDVNKFIRTLGFELSPDQKKAVREILGDMRSDKAMYRLLQGDVGCGKTAVAEIALYANWLSGYRGAIMAPTEILARQHYASFVKVFPDMKIGLLCGGVDDIKSVKRSIAEGAYDIVVGTHALFSDDVEISDLGLIITDEQHRFGVRQRRKLKDKSMEADFLSMSATPIPRTLASSIYGDCDISSIETMPEGRKGCETILVKENGITSIIPVLMNKLAEGRQIYIVGTAVERSENYSGKDVTTLYMALKELFAEYGVEMLHGRMSSEEKSDVMKRFENNETQILVTTTVVEVGVSVSNATVMVIYDADRFGLSQIHQLRGRVQRSSHRGLCYLLTDSKDPDTLKRLDVLVRSNDGFEISYEDLKLRGPGDILGTRQSGLPTFILGNLFTDDRFIKAARADAHRIFADHSDREEAAFFEKIMGLCESSIYD